MRFEWSDLLAALSLMLVFEGLLPFLNPAGWRRVFSQLAQNTDVQLRLGGLLCMGLGMLVLFWVRS